MKRKLLVMVLFVFLALGINAVISFGAINASSKTVNSGENVTISVSSTEKLVAYTISVVDEGGLTFVDSAKGDSGSGIVQKEGEKIGGVTTEGSFTNLGSFTFKTPNVSQDTTYNVRITLSGAKTIEGAAPSGATTVSATVTVKAPVQQTQAPTQAPTTPPTQAPTPNFSGSSETVYATSDVTVRSNPTTKSNSLGQLNTGESVTRTGVSDIKVDGYYWSKVTFKGQTGYIASGFLTTTKPEETPTPTSTPDAQKSNDGTLKTLEITGVELSPAFEASVTEYTANIAEDVNEIEVIAEANNEKATVEIVGNKELKLGENVIMITVTAEDGTVTNYQIKVTKGAVDLPTINLIIKGIKENGEEVTIELKPKFANDVFEYTVDLVEFLKSISIEGTVDDENIIIDGIGQFDLKVGKNEYVLTLISQSQDDNDDEKAPIKYKITINNPEKVVPVEPKTDNKNLKQALIIAGVAVLAVAGIVAIIIICKKRRNSEEYEEENYSYSNEEVEPMNENETVEQNEVNASYTDSQVDQVYEENNEPKEEQNEIKRDEDSFKSRIDNIFNIEAGDDYTSKRKRKGKHF